MSVGIKCAGCANIFVSVIPSAGTHFRCVTTCCKCSTKQRILVMGETITIKIIQDKVDITAMSNDTLEKYIQRVSIDNAMIAESDRVYLKSLEDRLAGRKRAAEKMAARKAVVNSATDDSSKALKKGNAGMADLAMLALQSLVEDGEVDANEAARAINLWRSQGDGELLKQLTGFKKL